MSAGDPCFLTFPLPAASQLATEFSTSCFRLETSQAPSPNGMPASPLSDEAPGAAGHLLPGAQGAGTWPLLQGKSYCSVEGWRVGVIHCRTWDYFSATDKKTIRGFRGVK